MLSFEVLQVIWWLLVIVLLSGFVIFDGFDIGALTLNPFVAKTDAERRVVLNTIAPHWDGNQVWLLLGGGAIFAAWPEVYATSFSGLYLAMILILCALYFRPVGMEYRHKFDLEKHRRGVDWALFFSGVVPSLVIGVGLGNVLLGLPFQFDSIGRSYYGGDTIWILNLLKLLNPFGLLCG
ncbi:cytochrome d ubiquinol oxidase subunit II, partial [Psittacicella gerlachiana]